MSPTVRSESFKTENYNNVINVSVHMTSEIEI